MDCLRKSVQQTIEMAVKDPLTGLHNRRYFDNQFKTMFEKAVSSSEPLSVIICDIDHFKSVNDTYGHDVGDAVIKACAKLISNNVRGLDMACRYGGEEFVLVFPNTGLEQSLVAAENLRNTINNCLFQYNKKNVPITVSIGIAEFTEEDDIESVFNRADKALYEAKTTGKNRCLTTNIPS